MKIMHADCSANGLLTVNLGFTLHIYMYIHISIDWLVHKGINFYIYSYKGHIFIYWAFKQYI